MDPLIIFIHNVKAAGTTLRGIFRRQYEPGAVFTTSHAYFDLAQLDLEPVRAGVEQGKLHVVQGHIPFGLHEHVTRSATYVTLLRAPVDRLVSHYHSRVERGYGARVLRSGDRTMSLEEYVETGGVKELDNAMTRRLSGLDPDVGGCSRAMLERAKEHLDRHFSVVGLSERFDETLVLLARTFGWKYLLYTRTNVTAERPPIDSLPSTTRDLIAARNVLDVELYEHATRLFEAALDRQGPDLRRAVDALRRVNRANAAGGPRGRAAGEYEADLRRGMVEEHRWLVAREGDLDRELRGMRGRRTRAKAALEQVRRRVAQLEKANGRARAVDDAL